MTQPAAASGGRPIGQPRKAQTVILLSILTCGIYAIFWIYTTFEELKAYNGEGQGGGMGLLLCLVFIGWWRLCEEIEKMFQADGKQSPVTSSDAIMAIIPFVNYFLFIPKVQDGLNDFWVSKGATPAA
jgi:Domain of unknown function (DUF4234)